MTNILNRPPAAENSSTMANYHSGLRDHVGPVKEYSPSLVKTHVNTKLAILFGILDSLAPISYLLIGEALPVQIAALLIKIAAYTVLPSSFHANRSTLGLVLLLYFMTTVGAFIDAANGTFSTVSVVRYFSFTASLSLTIFLIEHRSIRTYARSFVIFPFIGAISHIILSYTGYISDHYGRFLYLGDTHPNLGGEISAIVAVMAALGFRAKTSLAISTTLLLSAYLMQSRASLVVIILVMGTILFREISNNYRGFGRHALYLTVTIFTCSVVWAQQNFILESVLLYDDVHRGAGTGFVGRDERWLAGLDFFYANILFGSGLGIYDRGDVYTPHNAFIYGLAQHGVTSLLFWALILNGYRRMLRVNVYDAMSVGCIFLLLLFNDRFINLNLYPFGLYVVLLCYPRGLIIK